ncbi:MAG: EscU/YscU/HrcU family type III secretion system export apparatus switch protein [Planctomycetia bacterium]
MSDDADRSLPATPRRREAARDQGAAPNAALPAFVAMVAAAVLLLPGWSRTAVPAAGTFMRESLAAAFTRHGHDAIDASKLVPAQVLLPTAALVLATAGAGLCIRFLFDGSAWRLSRAAPRWRRIDPLAGIARVLSVATLRAVLWNGACLAVIVCAAAFAAGPLVGLLQSSAPVIEAERPLTAIRAVLLPVLLAAAAVAAAQWGLARLAFERRLRMTPEEYKEEMRGLEADPRIKLERRK